MGYLAMPLVTVGLVLLFLAARRARRARRRREDAAMVVTTWPDIELSQRYGGWDAGNYDAGTGHDGNAGPAHRVLVGYEGNWNLPRAGAWARKPHVGR